MIVKIRTKRVIFYVDGFNLYCTLLECVKRDSRHHSFKWFDLYKFLKGLLRKDGSEQMEMIYYFSVYFPWDSSPQPFRDDPSKEVRYKIYRKALEAHGIHTELYTDLTAVCFSMSLKRSRPL